MYVLYKLEYTYIFKHERVHKNICMKASGSRMYMYNYQFRQNRHIHEANENMHKNMEYKSKCMNHQNQAILVHLMGTNEQSSTNI